MFLSDRDQTDNLFKKHSEICNKLNLAQEITSGSWKTYTQISENYVLEGCPHHWLACAVYVECKMHQAKEETKNIRNCINLTALLRHSNLSLIQFFSNMEKWIEMAGGVEEIKEQMAIVQSKFYVSSNVFKIYTKLYGNVFKIPDSKEFQYAKIQRSRKQRIIPCSSVKVFEFCWNLFLALKSQEQALYRDIVKSTNLLIACMDLIFMNAFLSNRRDLINPECPGLPASWLSPDIDMQDEPYIEAPAIVDVLSKCQIPGDSLDAQYMKQYNLKSLLNKLYRKSVLRGNIDNNSGLLDGDNFDHNFKEVHNAYSTQMLLNCDVDERILYADFRRKICVESHSNPLNEMENGGGVALDSPRGMITDSPRMPHNFSDTPLTGRRYLYPRDHNSASAKAMMKISLDLSLKYVRDSPSDQLTEILRSVEDGAVDKIKSCVNGFNQQYIDKLPDQVEYAKSKANLATKLFYKLIESLLVNEKAMNKDISALIQNHVFYKCVYVCALEIALHAHGSTHKFMSLLNMFNLQSFNFLKIIELVIRCRDSQLNRQSIKHLSQIEESILDHLMWTSDSYLWKAIKANGGIPKFEDVALPHQMIYDEGIAVPKSVMQSPGAPMSGAPSAADTFQSPVNPHASRQLFSTTGNSSVFQKHIMITSKEGNCLIPILDFESRQKLKQNSPSESESSSPAEESVSSTKPRKSGSLAITLRKFYNLAWVRLDHLCTKLAFKGAATDSMIQKIWTLFEDSITNTDFMKDRHLDQLIMCAVYVVCKYTCKGDIKFSDDIMKCYRLQPQAKPFIYRNVLVKRKEFVEKDGQTVCIEEVRSDIIDFYNKVYILDMQKWALRFYKNQLGPRPMPFFASPSREIARNVFVKPLESPGSANRNTENGLHYCFSRSPSKVLKDINTAVKNHFVSGKRLLVDPSGDLPAKRLTTSANRKVQSLIEERKSQVSE